MSIKKTEFGKLKNGKTASLYTIENKNGMKVVLSDFGATIINIFVKDKNDNLVDVALGHLSLEQYESNPGNLGCVVGRNANRIEAAEITIDNEKYKLETNDGDNNLHTGSAGLQTRLFSATTNNNHIMFYTTVGHLEDGFPGNLNVEVKYSLSEDNELLIDYRATSDRDTVVNLTNHNYFNLNGQDESSINKHQLKIDANFYSPNTKDSIPTGEILNVKATDFDFIESTSLKKPINSDAKQVRDFGGIDHNFLLNNTGYRKVANLYNPNNSINLEILTDRNAMHVYTANHFPDIETINKDNLTYPLHGGIAFETQTVPNALKMPWLKSPLVKANEIYETSTGFKFSLK